MKISIITATRNSAAHIAGCLASVNSQSLHSHTMTQSHGMTDSEQNFRKNNTGQARQINHAGQASFEIEHIIIDGASRDKRTEVRGHISDFRLLSSVFCPTHLRTRLDLLYKLKQTQQNDFRKIQNIPLSH
jgi:hypothetical protein